MKQIGIFGGSYNPIHIGHINLAKFILNNTSLNEVWLMISPQNPLKEKKDLMPDQLRLKWATDALKGEKDIKASDFEFNLSKPSYTYNTLTKLKEKYTHYSFSLIIGADNWLIFNKWFKYQEILNNFNIIIYPNKN